MRTCIGLLLILLVGCAGPERTANVPAGVDDSAAPSGARSVVVRTSVRAQKAYKELGRTLQRHGYGIQSSDSDLQTISTSWKTISKGMGPNVSTSLSAGIVDTDPTRIRFSGRYKAAQFDASSIEKAGSNGSATRQAWAEMVTVAHQVSQSVGGQLVFAN